MYRWDPSLETGDALVDEQHRFIHGLFNQLETAQDGTDTVLRTLDALSEYALVHFATEEQLMAREDYGGPAMEEHLAQHRAFLEATRERILDFRSGQLTSIAPIVSFLREWLTAHVHECDRLLIDYVRARGGAARMPE